MRLPIDEIERPLLDSLGRGGRSFVVSAPTGSGKSTRLPVMLAQSEAVNGMVLVMQPRRVAARMLAKRVSKTSGFADGSVGWHVRFEKHYGPNAKIVFLTEGILARMLLADPKLGGVGAIIFDEFHERNIYADISLALALRCREKFRPDLVLAACSASMDFGALASHLNAEVFECGGRLFPVEYRYAPPKAGEPVWERAAAEFSKLSREFPEGDFLIFMPGVYEISRTVGRLLEAPAARGFDVLALHGDLPPEQQDKILAPSSRRRVIVSTNVAETSLTIEGVRFVIDSGQVRVARFDAARGLNTLLVERESLASAVQRAGRAGRTCAGVAVRLWREADEVYFDKYTDPEISRLDVSQILLWLKAAGLGFEDLALFEAPPEASTLRAQDLLRKLGALDNNGKITPDGLVMADFPAQPRLARMIIDGFRLGCAREACLVAALTDVGRVKLPLENAFAEAERDALSKSAESEVEELLSLCRAARESAFNADFCRKFGIHGANARRAWEGAAELFRTACDRLGGRSRQAAEGGGALAKCVLGAFPDHLCARLNKGTFACRVVGGRKGEIRKSSRAWAADIFVALELGEQNVAGGANILASMLVPVSAGQIEEVFPGAIRQERSTYFDQSQKRVVCRRSAMFADLPLSESSDGEPDPAERARIFRDGIVSGKIVLKNFGDAEKNFINRVNFVAAVLPDAGIQPIDENALSEIYELMCLGCESHSDVKNADVLRALREWLSPHQLWTVDSMAPRFVELPGRRRPVEIRYEPPAKRAVVASLFKDFYGYDGAKLKICGGAVLPTFEVLAPNGRPVQTTQNLGEFFKTSWLPIKKQLKARYPKHFKSEPD